MIIDYADDTKGATGYSMAATYDTVLITTYGAIVAEGNDGVAGSSSYTNCSVQNNGAIVARYGMDMQGDDTSIVNGANGTITSDEECLRLLGSYDNIVNLGSMVGRRYSVSFEQGGGDTFINSGTVSGYYAVYVGFTTNAVKILNSGTIRGNESAIASNGGGYTTLTNTPTGYIEGAITLGSGSLIHNDGLIAGAVYFFGSNQAVFDGNGTLRGTLSGSAGNDLFDLSHQTVTGTISGGAGSDTITGTAGNDVIYGESAYLGDTSAGDDVIDGGPGNDTMDGGIGTNTLSYQSATAGVIVDLVTGTASGGGGSDMFSQFQKVVGSNYADVITGDGGDNIIAGGQGADVIHGGGGNDTIDGGFGGDTTGGYDLIDGGAGNDTVSYASATSGVTLNLGIQGQVQATGGGGNDYLLSIENITASAFNDVLIGDGNANVIHAGSGDDIVAAGGGNDFVYGEDGNDTINGGAGNNRLYGGYGNDTIVGGANGDLIQGDYGRDTLTGGGGQDIFAYQYYSDSTADAPDLITDFQSGIDLLDLRNLHTDAKDTFKISSSGGYTYVIVDQRGDGFVDAMIKLTGTAVVKTSDVLWANAAFPAATHYALADSGAAAPDLSIAAHHAATHDLALYA